MNKFVLVDAQLYKGLMDASKTGHQNLDFAKQSLEKAKSERTPPSTKNIKVNQALRRYLSLKNQVENKPIKVELTQGPRVLVSKSRGAIAYANDEDEDELNETDAFITPQSHPTRSQRRPTSSRRRRPVQDGDETLRAEQLAEQQEPSTSTPIIKKFSGDEAIDMNERIGQLYRILNGNRDRYRVSGDTILNRRGFPVPQSSLKASIRYIINERKNKTRTATGRRIVQPPGTQYLREILKSNPILSSYTNPRQGNIEKFSPSLWK
jgi:hypothetical protein